MEIYDSPLNQAHLYANKAETALTKKNLSKSIYYHQQAAEALSRATDLINSGKALESIVLQIKYHNRQVELLIDRRNKAKTAEQDYTPDNNSIETSGMEMNETCKDQLFDTLLECDSLLKFLNDGDKNHLNKKESPQTVKKDKDTQTILEELMIHNDSLRKHILGFVIKVEELEKDKKQALEQLNQSKAEVEKLKNELKKYKKDCV